MRSGVSGQAVVLELAQCISGRTPGFAQVSGWGSSNSTNNQWNIPRVIKQQLTTVCPDPCVCSCRHQVAVTVPSATPKFFSTPDTQQIAVSTQRSLLTQVRCRRCLGEGGWDSVTIGVTDRLCLAVAAHILVMLRFQVFRIWGMWFQSQAGSHMSHGCAASAPQTLGDGIPVWGAADAS